jgi:SAM-dependent methyltransferase
MHLASPPLALIHLALAWLRGGPGLAMHLRAARLGIALALRRAEGLPRGFAAGLALAPLDSFRYFEFEFAWESAAACRSGGRYLDVSSPRLFPILLLRARRDLASDLINPHRADLAITRALVDACGLRARCTLHAIGLEQLSFPEETFDLITSLSVIEHIPAPGDAQAVRTLWRLLRPGGRLVVTVPCAREALEEWVDLDEYGLTQADRAGFFLGQRFYDQALLEEVFFRTCGPPERMQIFGEKRAGSFFRDRERKLAGTNLPWREPYMMAAEYARFREIAALPGWGVAAMAFVKKG